jgi:methanogen homocitrate synthase
MIKLEKTDVQNKINVSPFNFYKDVDRDMKIPKEIIIHDTTLREGEQAPGVVFSPDDKLVIGQWLDKIGVQQLESGFPAASPGEMEAVTALAKEGLNAKIFGFGRAVKSDIDAVIKTGAWGIVISFPPSDIHLKYKLKMTREEYLERAVTMVEYAKAHGLFISYSAEDSTRADLEFLKKTFKTVVEAGVDRVRIVDTLGAIHPSAMKFLVKEIMRTVDAPIEVHCHNDHALGVANTLAAIETGATTASTSLLGLGERAGLAATEEVILALYNLYNVRYFDISSLYRLCRFIEEVSGVTIYPSKVVAGRNIFTHATGIHQHGVLQNSTTYEPYPPELVGQKRRLVLGKLSGSHAVSSKLNEFGIKATKKEVKKILSEVKKKSEKRKSVLSDNEFLKIVQRVTGP